MSLRRTRITAAIVKQQSVGWLSDRIHEDQARIDIAAVQCVACGRWGHHSQYHQASPRRCLNQTNCTIRRNNLVPPDEEPNLSAASPLIVQRARRSLDLCLNELRRRGFVDAALSEAGLLRGSGEGGGGFEC